MLFEFRIDKRFSSSTEIILRTNRTGAREDRCTSHVVGTYYRVIVREIRTEDLKGCEVLAVVGAVRYRNEGGGDGDKVRVRDTRRYIKVIRASLVDPFDSINIHDTVFR